MQRSGYPSSICKAQGKPCLGFTRLADNEKFKRFILFFPQRWQKDGGSINESLEVTTTTNTTVIESQLVFEHLLSLMAGEYSCSVWYVLDQVKSTKGVQTTDNFFLKARRLFLLASGTS